MFKLVRYFSVTSFIAFFIVTVALGLFYRQTAVDDLMELRENNNVALTQTFANSIWPEFAPFVSSASGLSTDELQDHPETSRLRELVLRQMDGLSVVKVKIYDLEALTVFSTEAAQIGEDKSDNAGYLAARSGEVATELTHRDTFSAFEQTIEDRDVISSYVPIQPEGPDGAVVGVFEVYDDVTPLLQRVEQKQRNIVVGIVIILAILYGALFVIVRHGGRLIKQQQAELVVARDDALTALHLKNQILANVSHDARTPLSVIKLKAGMLLNNFYGEITEGQKDAVESIDRSTQQMLYFINTLLDQAALSSGKLDLRQIAYDPRELLRELAQTMQPLAESKELSFSTTIKDELPSTLVGDPDRLKQVFFNLISNAIKFTSEGSVELRVSRPDIEHLMLQVIDTGVGIPKEAQAHLFKAFWQVDGSTTRQTSGVGLGLSIVSSLVKLMDGEISVESIEGSGSTFSITLPIRADHRNDKEEKVSGQAIRAHS